jgi:hypothetical protein
MASEIGRNRAAMRTLVAHLGEDRNVAREVRTLLRGSAALHQFHPKLGQGAYCLPGYCN